jgi:hypothetical protein
VIADGNGVGVVQAALRTHVTDVNVVRNGLDVLQGLADHYPPSKQTIVNHQDEALAAVLDAMKGRHLTDAGVQVRGCQLLLLFARAYPSCAQTIANAGGGELVRTAMQTHPANIMVQQKGKSLLAVLPAKTRFQQFIDKIRDYMWLVMIAIAVLYMHMLFSAATQSPEVQPEHDEI